MPTDPPTPRDSDLARLLLEDRDGDGVLDALRGLLVTADAAPAAAELLPALASGSVRFDLDPHPLVAPCPALFLGPGPAGAPPSPESGARLERRPGGVWLVADDPAALRAAARRFAAWWLAPALEGAADPLPDTCDPAALAADPGPAAPHALPEGSALGALLVEGDRWGPAALADDAPPAALRAVARASAAGLQPPHPLLVAAGHEAEAALLVALDPELPPDAAELRLEPAVGGERLRLAGGDDAGLARAAVLFHGTWPRLPDGSWLDDLEARLGALLAGESRLGALAAVGAELTLGGGDAAALPNPTPCAPRRLGVPVRNSTRDGALERLDAVWPWEGTRFLDALDEDDAPLGSRVVVTAWLGESFALRAELAERARARLRARGLRPRVRVRSAFRPGLHWLLEEVGPALGRRGVVRLEVDCAPPRVPGSAEVRWLRELHPAAELLEAAHPGLRVRLELEPDRRRLRVTYRARGYDAAGALRLEMRLTPPRARRPYLGLAHLGEVEVTPGWLTMRVAGGPHREHPLPTDAELAWGWFCDAVLPRLRARITPGETGPFFEELALTLALSEPDAALPLDHEGDSALEALHEELYFGALEALDDAAGSVAPRRLAPGRILPFCRAAPGRDGRVGMRLRAPGSRRLAVRRGGTWRAVPHRTAAVRCRALRDEPGRAPRASFVIDAADAGAAATLAARLAWVLEHAADHPEVPLPRGVALRFEVHRPDASPIRLDHPPLPLAASTPWTVPERPLRVAEASALLRAWVRTEPRLRLRTPYETRLGQPLHVLELTYPGGPGVSFARLVAWRESALLSARQHANEASSSNAALHWLQALLADPAPLRSLNLIVHPLENPDGARLHRALCSLAPRHMHHAARYTSSGADLQADPSPGGRLQGESALRRDSWRRWRPRLHLNNHGYPAHEWLRPWSGHLPRGFEAWSLPIGHMTILLSAPDRRQRFPPLRAAVAAALAGDVAIASFTRRQVARNQRYQRGLELPFRYARGLPFWESLREPGAADPAAFAPELTVITEVPDETVDGVLWRDCVRAHQRVNAAVVAVWLELSATGS